MTRSTKADKARQLNAAHRTAPAPCRVARGSAALVARVRFVRRQAYRYLQEAAQLGRPVEVAEATMPITLKLPPRTVGLLREYARSSGLTMGAIVTRALEAFLRALRKHG